MLEAAGNIYRGVTRSNPAPDHRNIWLCTRMTTGAGELQWAKGRRVALKHLAIGVRKLIHRDAVKFVFRVGHIPLAISIIPCLDTHGPGIHAAGLILHEALTELELDGLGVALIDHVVQGGNPAAVVLDVGEFFPVDNLVCEVRQHGAVHHEKSLLRYRGDETLACGGVRVGEVKRLEHLIQIAAIHQGVNSTAVIGVATR